MKVVTLTLNPAVDKSCSVDHVVPERKLRCGPASYHPGGGGLNVARAIAELGGEAEAYWTCGGAVGELLKQALDREQIPHHPIPIAEMTRENLIVFEESSEQQFRFGMPGARMSESEANACVEVLRGISPDYLVLSGSLPPGIDVDFYGTLTDSVADGCRVVLDTSGEALVRGLRAGTFLIKPNLNELAQLAGRDIEGDEQIRDVAMSLIERRRAEVIVTSLGSGGATLTTADLHEHIRSPTVKIRSKVGAGDSTVAGIVFALTQGRSISEAARFGVAAGAAAVMTEGTELCRRDDVERLFEQIQTSIGAA